METSLQKKKFPEKKIPEISMGLQKVKSELPAQMPYMNTLDRVAEDFGGRDEFVDACRLSNAPVVQTFVRLSEECEGLPLSDICAKSNLMPDKLLELIVPALYRWNGSVGKMLNAINVPKTMKAGIETAQMVGPEGFQDR
jgi:hypothetical protein